MRGSLEMIRRTYSKSRKIRGSTRAGWSLSQARQSPVLQSNKVEADVYIDGVFDEKRGVEVAGTHAECMKCGHVTKSFGVKEGSAKRCLVLLKQECPKGENNYYVEKEKEFDCPNCKKRFKVSQWKGEDFNICPECGEDSLPF